MTISTKDFATMVSEQVTAIQARASQLVNFTIGSVLRAMVETNAAVGLWIQGLIVSLLATTRAATSNSADLYSWMADYGVTPLPATASTGNVTLSRFTPTSQALIPFGSLVQTADGTQKYSVTINVSNPAYTAGGYVIAAGTASVTVPVQAVAAGYAGNAQAGQVTSLTQAITYVDTVTNTAAFVGGADAETDAQLRTRFVAYIASLSRATKAAIGFAISSVQSGVTWSIVENQQYGGSVDNGFFYIVVDDGSGAPPTSFMNAVALAVDAVRPVTSRFALYAPTIINATVAMTATIAAGYDPAATKLAAANAIKAYINALPIGAALVYSRLIQIAYDASPGITNVSSVVLNGGTADFPAVGFQVIKWSSVTVN